MDEVKPHLTIGAVLCSIVVWCYGTFALKDTVVQVNSTVDQIKKEASEDRQRNQQALEGLRAEYAAASRHQEDLFRDFSDRNRERMEVQMSQMRESLKAIKDDVRATIQSRLGLRSNASP